MYDFSFKIIMIGPGAVGKSSLIRRFVENEFSFNYKFTIGVEINSKMVEYRKGVFAKLTIWDIGGQDRFKILRRNFYDGTHGALVVFDLSRAQTLPKMKQWVADMNHILEKEIPMVVLGNKVDLLSKIGNVTDQVEARSFAEKIGSIYIETSAKSGNNVERAFAELVQIIVKNALDE
ncbi:MAG: Rab family GTPase [Promethearchaeota archaeon]